MQIQAETERRDIEVPSSHLVHVLTVWEMGLMSHTVNFGEEGTFTQTYFCDIVKGI